MNLLAPDKSLHYLYGSVAAVLGAALGMLFAALRGSALSGEQGIALFFGALGAFVAAGLAGLWKEMHDEDANERAARAHLAATDAAIDAGTVLPPPMALPHEVSAADLRATLWGCAPVIATLMLVALARSV